MAGYLYDAPAFTSSGAAFRESGAQSLVDPWKLRGAGVIGDEDATATAAARLLEAAGAAAGLVLVRAAVSPDENLSADEVDAGTSSRSPSVFFPHGYAIKTPAIDGPRYVFLGVPADGPDIVGISTSSAGNNIDLFTRVPNSVAGYKWWRFQGRQNFRGQTRTWVVFLGAG